MNSRLVKTCVWTVLVAGAALFTTSCVTTNGHWEPEFPEKGSAKGGASLLMQRK